MFVNDQDAEKLWPATRAYRLALMANFSAESAASR
jgi:hypothetical protein